MGLYNYFFHNDQLPKWLLLLNKISLCGILAWPLVLFASLFMFDDPNVNMRKMTTYCILLNSYPLALVLLSLLSYKLYSVNPILSAVFPAIPVLFYLFVVVLVMFFA